MMRVALQRWIEVASADQLELILQEIQFIQFSPEWVARRKEEMRIISEEGVETAMQAYEKKRSDEA
jgi:hypothetical protein